MCFRNTLMVASLCLLVTMFASPAIAQTVDTETKAQSEHPDQTVQLNEVTTTRTKTGVQISIRPVTVTVSYDERRGCYGYVSGGAFVAVPWLTKPETAPKSVNVTVNVPAPAKKVTHDPISIVVPQYYTITDKWGTRYIPYQTRVTATWQPLHGRCGYTDYSGRFHLLP